MTEADLFYIILRLLDMLEMAPEEREGIDSVVSGFDVGKEDDDE